MSFWVLRTEIRVVWGLLSHGPVVKTSPSNTGSVGLTPGQGTKIPHALQPRNQNRSNILTNFKNSPHQKNLKKKTKNKQLVWNDSEAAAFIPAEEFPI